MADWSCICTLSGHSKDVLEIEPLLTGNMASASKDNSIIIWNMTNMTILHRISSAHTDEVRVLKQLSNGFLASGSKDNFVNLWNGTYAKVGSYSTGQDVRAMEEVDGMLVVSTSSQNLFFLRISDLGLIRSITSGIPTDLNVLMNTADGSYFVAGTQNGFYQYWPSSATSYRSVLTNLQRGSDSIKSINRYENVFIMGDDSDDIYYWDVTDPLTGDVAGNTGVTLLSNAPSEIRTLACLNSTCKIVPLILLEFYFKNVYKCRDVKKSIDY